MFFWMLLHDRVNTRNLLRRKTFVLEEYNCAVLNCQQEETLHHLFWDVNFQGHAGISYVHKDLQTCLFLRPSKI
uniref:Uncharacterized protein n=1 Tax=Aegilops tauschii subsp. strangulata TaxID=200361 RepID=A0A452ZZW6_AEGTS